MTDVTAQPPSDAPSHLRGAVDLSSLGTPAPAGRTAPGADAGAGGGSWVIADADQGLLQQLVQLSAQVPVLLHLHVPGDAASEALYRQFADAVDAQAGRLVLARLDVAKEPAVLQALGLGAGPAVMAVVAGQPVPLVNQEVPEETLRQLMGEILEVARQNGVAGTVPAVAPARQDAGAAAAEAPPVPPLHRAAHEALAADDLPGAVSAWEAALADSPADAVAQQGLSAARLMLRTRDADASAVRAAAADGPDDGGTAGGLLRFVADCVENPAVLLSELERSGAFDRLRQRRIHGLGDGVLLLGPIQRDCQHAVRECCQNLFAHRRLPPPPALRDHYRSNP